MSEMEATLERVGGDDDFIYIPADEANKKLAKLINKRAIACASMPKGKVNICFIAGDKESPDLVLEGIQADAFQDAVRGPLICVDE